MFFCFIQVIFFLNAILPAYLIFISILFSLPVLCNTMPLLVSASLFVSVILCRYLCLYLYSNLKCECYLKTLERAELSAMPACCVNYLTKEFLYFSGTKYFPKFKQTSSLI